MEFDDVILFNFFNDPFSVKDDICEVIMNLIQIEDIVINHDDKKKDSDDENGI